MVTLATELSRGGLCVSLVLSKAEGPYLSVVPSDVQIVDLGCARVLWSLPRLAGYLRRERPSVVISAMTHANVTALWARRIARVSTRVIVTERNTLSRTSRSPCISIPVTVAISGCLFWEQIRVRLPRNKLHALYKDVRRLKFALLALHDETKDPSFTTDVSEQIASLSYKLDSLGIPRPAPYDRVIWIHWLAELAAWAHTKNIKAARTWPDSFKGGSQT